jgi:hypothetical protein
MAEKWIQGAIKHPGAFTKKAKAHGMSVGQYASKVTKPGSTASTQTKRQANLAKTLRGFHHAKGGECHYARGGDVKPHVKAVKRPSAGRLPDGIPPMGRSMPADSLGMPPSGMPGPVAGPMGSVPNALGPGAMNSGPMKRGGTMKKKSGGSARHKAEGGMTSGKHHGPTHTESDEISSHGGRSSGEGEEHPPGYEHQGDPDRGQSPRAFKKGGRKYAEGGKVGHMGHGHTPPFAHPTGHTPPFRHGSKRGKAAEGGQSVPYAKGNVAHRKTPRVFAKGGKVNGLTSASIENDGAMPVLRDMMTSHPHETPDRTYHFKKGGNVVAPDRDAKYMPPMKDKHGGKIKKKASGGGVSTTPHSDDYGIKRGGRPHMKKKIGGRVGDDFDPRKGEGKLPTTEPHGKEEPVYLKKGGAKKYAKGGSVQHGHKSMHHHMAHHAHGGHKPMKHR